MAKDEKETPAEAPKKKSKKLLIIIIAAVVVLGGGGAGAFFMLKGSSASAAPAPVKGIVTPLTDALTINLADGHYLKLNFSIQETADAGTTAVDTAEAINAAINIYTGMTEAELSTEKGRDAAKAELLAECKKAYNTKDLMSVMDIYYTAFVTQ
jgi:flagellar FliL protein